MAPACQNTDPSGPANPYESGRLLSEYLLFHYGAAAEVLPYAFGPRESLDFPTRCLRESFDVPPTGRVLDIGCAVGRLSFELARTAQSVVGIDFSRQFIQAANQLQQTGHLEYRILEEGSRDRPAVASVPEGIDRSRVRFEEGDAGDLRPDLGLFEAVIAANLLCRLPDPARFLQRTRELVKPGGRLVLTTPCSWLEQYTPKEKWICGATTSTLEGLHPLLEDHFVLIKTLDLPFLLREHARKYQWVVSLLSVWQRRDGL